MSLTITDISVWEDDLTTTKKIDFVKMKSAGAVGVIFKASQALRTDAVFLSSWKDAKAAGLIRGAYLYLDWTKPGKDQGSYFANLLLADPPELPPVIDYECRLPTGIYDPTTELKAALNAVEGITKRIPWIYTSSGYWADIETTTGKKYGGTSTLWTRYPLWVAHWTTAATPLLPFPWTSYVLWQYTSKGSGITYGTEALDIDLNRFQGTLAQLNVLCGKVEGTKYTTSIMVNVRSGPLDTDTIIGVIPAGTVVVVDGSAGSRSHISSPINGWVWTAYLKLIPLTPAQQLVNWARTVNPPYTGPDLE